ncbi:hypothetical protein [uncultured Methanospirillum sp.]|uniref:hypothetical protein n=1 Tax=uncultured Methanospirillum sp. TaxID=262503 RepID=UPI0029C7481B|nr:hypothetical protein [uncultured Methanospirillum sp.]
MKGYPDSQNPDFLQQPVNQMKHGSLCHGMMTIYGNHPYENHLLLTLLHRYGVIPIHRALFSSWIRISPEDHMHLFGEPDDLIGV